MILLMVIFDILIFASLHSYYLTQYKSSQTHT